MYSGEYDVCDVTLSVYPHRASLKNTTVGIEPTTFGGWSWQKKMEGKTVKGKKFKGKKVYFTHFSDNHTLLSLLYMYGRSYWQKYMG
jgi:hypothetical protein